MTTICRVGNTINTKIKLFDSNIKTILLYGCETFFWKITKYLIDRLQVFIYNCLKQILKIIWPEKITNVDLWKKTKQLPIELKQKKWKWRWIGYTLRNQANSITRKALQWNPQGKRKFEGQETHEEEIYKLKWKQRNTRGKTWSNCHKIELYGGVLLVACAPSVPKA